MRAFLAAICLSAVAAAPAPAPNYHVVGKLAAGDGGWDILSVDPVDQRLYIGRPNGVTAIDLKTGKATDKIVPGQRVGLSVVQRFRQGNDAVREMIHRAASHDVNHLRFKNPFVPLLRFTVGSGFLIITRHQKRHLLQAERVRQSAEFPR